MITIVKVIAVGAALSGSPAAHPGKAPSVEAGAPVIRLDQVPTERVHPLGPKTRVAVALSHPVPATQAAPANHDISARSDRHAGRAAE